MADERRKMTTYPMRIGNLKGHNAESAAPEIVPQKTKRQNHFPRRVDYRPLTDCSYFMEENCTKGDKVGRVRVNVCTVCEYSCQ